MSNDTFLALMENFGMPKERINIEKKKESKITCPFCKGDVKEKTYELNTHHIDPKTGTNIIMPNARCYECLNCKETWDDPTYGKEIEKYIRARNGIWWKEYKK